MTTSKKWRYPVPETNSAFVSFWNPCLLPQIKNCARRISRIHSRLHRLRPLLNRKRYCSNHPQNIFLVNSPSVLLYILSFFIQQCRSVSKEKLLFSETQVGKTQRRCAESQQRGEQYCVQDQPPMKLFLEVSWKLSRNFVAHADRSYWSVLRRYCELHWSLWLPTSSSGLIWIGSH